MDEQGEKLQAQISQIVERIAEMRSDHRAILHRLQAVEENAKRVTEIEKEPGERWKKIGFELIKYIVLAAAGAAIGFLMK